MWERVGLERLAADGQLMALSTRELLALHGLAARQAHPRGALGRREKRPGGPGRDVGIGRAGAPVPFVRRAATALRRRSRPSALRERVPDGASSSTRPEPRYPLHALRVRALLARAARATRRARRSSSPTTPTSRRTRTVGSSTLGPTPSAMVERLVARTRRASSSRSPRTTATSSGTSSSGAFPYSGSSRRGTSPSTRSRVGIPTEVASSSAARPRGSFVRAASSPTCSSATTSSRTSRTSTTSSRASRSSSRRKGR